MPRADTVTTALPAAPDADAVAAAARESARVRCLAPTCLTTLATRVDDGLMLHRRTIVRAAAGSTLTLQCPVCQRLRSWPHG